MRNVTIVLTFFGLWLSTQLSSTIQDYVAYGLILTFGILHGANDIAIMSSLTKGKGPLKKHITPYLVAILLVSILFFMSKGIALLFFILISAYHFGEQHFSDNLKRDSASIPFLYFFYGIIILFMIFTIRLNEVIFVVKDIAGWTLERNVVLGVLIVASVITMALGFLLRKEGALKVSPVKEFFYLLVLGIVFAKASLVWGFAIYFIFWHSLPSIKDQLIFLYGKANKNNLMTYVKASVLYWSISIIGLFLLYVILRDKVEYFITVVLYVLAAITFPHVLVMAKVETAKK